MPKCHNDKSRAELAPVSRQAACEGIVLLENREGALPLKPGETVSLFGRCQINTYRSGTGSGGAVNVPYAVSALEGLRANPAISLNEALVAIYESWVREHPFDDGGGGWAAEPWFQQEMPLTDDVVSQAASVSSKAFIFIGRTAGEDKDYADMPGSYRLTELETAMITAVAARFSQVVLVLNTTNIIDMSWLETIPGRESIKAVLYSWAAGMEGGHALADVLAGDVSPSGRLADTIAYRLEDYPSSANFGSTEFNCYAEDIYVGYRYFETFNPTAVQYPFGAGMSYTRFAREAVVLTTEGAGAELVVHVDSTVRNAGTTYAGKEVVQLYCEAPQGQLGKPARVLVGFAKTEVLQPGAVETVRVSIALHALASYDDEGVTGHCSCYVLEPGEYRFYVGGSVRHAQLIERTVPLEELVVTETLGEALAPIRDFERLKPGGRRTDGTYEETFLPVPQRTVDLAARIQSRLPPSLEPTGDRGIRLADVKHGMAKMEDFVAQMSREDLATFVRGEGMCSPKVTPGTAAAFGGTTARLFKLGIPVAAAADGPSGIRMDSGHKATQVPIGTLLACTWNVPLNQELFHLVGQELRAYHIDTLLGPGINIHRHPLNGRNFEYFSEDPLMTGTMAAAQTLGLASAGVTGTIKHLAANEQETARNDADSVVSERALREVYLKPFEMAVKQGSASTIMTSYNPVNGHWAASNYDLNTTILRSEWGYTGIVMSDWWAKMNHNAKGGQADRTFTSFMLRAQNDLYMVVANAAENPLKDNTLEALEKGDLTLGELQRAAMNICRFIMRTPAMDRPLVPFNPVKSFAARSILRGQAVELAAGIDLNATTNTTASIEVAEAGVYRVRARVRNPRSTAAQSSCSLYLNGDFAMTIPVNGTDGEWIEVEGIQVQLEQGGYDLALDFVKPGLELARLTFERVQVDGSS